MPATAKIANRNGVMGFEGTAFMQKGKSRLLAVFARQDEVAEMAVGYLFLLSD